MAGFLIALITFIGILVGFNLDKFPPALKRLIVVATVIAILLIAVITYAIINFKGTTTDKK